MNRDPRLLYGADIRKRILDEVTDADGNSRIVGDADTGGVADIASWTTPVPGVVGPGTVAILMRDAAIAFEKQIQLGWV